MLAHFYHPLLFIMGLSLISGPVGSLMIWRKMTFFGETLAHGTLVAFLIQYFTLWPLPFCMALVVLFYSLILELLERTKGDYLSTMPILSYGIMGLGLLITETAVKQPKMIYRVFLGDLLLTQYSDCLNLFILAFVIMSVVYSWYRAILLSLFSRDLAVLHYPYIPFMIFGINMLMGLSVSMTVQSIGMLLAMALLTIPSLIASHWSHHPWQMMLGGSAVAMLGSSVGFIMSLVLNWPMGPAITVVLLVLYVTSDVCKKFSYRRG